MRVIGMCGYARSGKDQAAKELIARGFTRVAFADCLKDEVCRTFGITREQLESDKETWRPLLVEWGRGRRRMDPDYWIKRAAANLPANDIVVTDVRYPNEARWIWSLGGHLIRIIRPGVEACNEEERVTVCEVDKIALRRTFRLDNSGTIEDLNRKVKTVWQNLS